MNDVDRFSQLAAPPIFVVGAARSGTTWVYDILTAHPQVAGLYESWLFTPAHGLGALFTSMHWADKPTGLGRVLSRAALLETTRLTATDLMSHALFPEHRYLVEKSPSHIFAIELINEIFPAARFIHVIRDGRDVAVSVRAASRSWMPSWRNTFGNSIRTSSQTWKNSVQRGREQGQRLGDRYLEVRYEQIKQEPIASYRRMFDFCGILYDDSVLQQIYEKTDFERNYIPNEQGFRRGGRISDWRSHFGLRDANIFKSVAGDTLIELGYEPDQSWGPSPAAAISGVVKRGIQQTQVRVMQLRKLLFLQPKPSHHKENRPKTLIISGHPRSGTTMFTSLCNSHPQIAITYEFGSYIGIKESILMYLAYLRRNVASRRVIEPIQSNRFIERVRNIAFLLRFLSKMVLKSMGRPIQAASVSGVLHDLFPSAKVIGDKHPIYREHLAKLTDGEDVCCVMLYRDCRDVVRSSIEMSNGAWRGRPAAEKLGTVEKAAHSWIEAIETMESYGTRVFPLRYERLVQDPTSVLAEFSEWLGVDSSGFNRAIIRQTSLGKYKEGLSNDDISLIEEIAGPTLRRLGYD